jgi:hypothetical protein
MLFWIAWRRTSSLTLWLALASNRYGAKESHALAESLGWVVVRLPCMIQTCRMKK